ncbi:HAD-IIB family hydrolase [Haloferula sp. A504]|uniref:HAD-IIB family hydrolase n=1 Tax=Haloferula sp. A504 TaxID=3373601 RepID=UPI0031C489EB|nr:HAD family hydrolase [Verrucomicrobiaceae bacterium E54]
MPETKRVALFCSDLDGTLLGLPEASADFRRIWDSLGDDRPVLVYSTGRLVEDAMRVIRAGGLPEPDYYIGGVGTVIHDPGAGGVIPDYAEALSEDWDLAKAIEVVRSFSGIEEQPAEQQNECKSSWFWHDASPADLDRLRAALDEAGVTAQVIYSSARDLDVLPRRANKGNALRWICGKLGVPLDEAVVAGDTGNDSSMFQVEGVRGIVPANAEPELIEAVRDLDAFRARGECAAGIIEGLIHHGVFPQHRS